jgi:hypothetical protein
MSEPEFTEFENVQNNSANFENSGSDKVNLRQWWCETEPKPFSQVLARVNKAGRRRENEENPKASADWRSMVQC